MLGPHSQQTDDTAPKPRMYAKDDPDMPEEFRQFLIKLLKYAHVENNGNPHYRKVLATIAYAGLRYAPDRRRST